MSHDLTAARKNARTGEDAAAIAWAQDEIEKLHKLLSDVDTAMCVHGKVDAGTDLHDRIQRAYGVE